MARTVLSRDDIARAIRRIAHEIIERNRGAENILLLGIPTRGVTLAERLQEAIAEIEAKPVSMGSIDITLHRDDLRRECGVAGAIRHRPRAGQGIAVVARTVCPLFVEIHMHCTVA